MSQSISMIAFLLMTFTQANAASSYLTFWTARPTNPDNGVYILNPGVTDLFLINQYERLTYKANFTEQTDIFKKQGGWMKDIKSVQVETYLDEDLTTDISKEPSRLALYLIEYKDGRKQRTGGHCLYFKSSTPNTVVCYFNHFDSITIKLD